MNKNYVITNKMPSVVLILIMILSSFTALVPTQIVKALGTESVNFVDTAFDLHYGISIAVSGGTNLDSDADGDGYTPGFTAALGVMSLLGAAIAIRRRRL